MIDRHLEGYLPVFKAVDELYCAAALWRLA